MPVISNAWEPELIEFAIERETMAQEKINPVFFVSGSPPCAIAPSIDPSGFKAAGQSKVGGPVSRRQEAPRLTMIPGGFFALSICSRKRE